MANEPAPDDLLAFARKRFGPTARVMRQELRILAGLLRPGEAVQAMACGRLVGGPRWIGQLVAGTPSRLIILQGSSRLGIVSRVEQRDWADVRSVDAGVISAGDREWRFREVLPEYEFTVLEELRLAEPGAPTPMRDMVGLVGDKVGGSAFWCLAPIVLKRLYQELRPGERVLDAAEVGTASGGLVVLTGERIGMVPATERGATEWFDLAAAEVITLDAADGLMVRSGNRESRWLPLRPPESVRRIADPLQIELRSRIRTQDVPRPVHAPVPQPADGLLSAVHRTEIDGVPVFWTDLPGRLTAHLIFGVGMRDETFLSAGITHLVEHLTMRAVPQPHYACNASVGPMVTDFEVASSPATVVEHLARVCAALGAADVRSIDVERKVLGAEVGDGGGAPASLWFGQRGMGLLGSPQLGIERVTAAEVEQWWRRWFHRGNAALALTGPPPPGLRLPLPAGAPNTQLHPAPLDLRTPARVDGNGFQLTMLATWSAELASAMQIFEMRLTNLLRHDRGLVYSLHREVLPTGGAEAVILLGGEVAGDVGEDVLRAVDELAVDGVTAEELRWEALMLRELVEDPETATSLPWEEAHWHLTGDLPNRTHYRRGLAGLDPEAIRAAFAAARARMVLAIPEDSPVGLPQLPGDDPVRGTEYAARPGLPKGSRLVIGDDGVSVRIGTEQHSWQTVRFADAVGLGVELQESDEVLTLTSGLGAMLRLDSSDWRKGRGIADAVRRGVPAHLHHAVPERLCVPIDQDWA